MNTPSHSPLALSTEGNALVIEWEDGAKHKLPWEFLRDRCPCASCRTKRQEPAPLLPVLTLQEAQPIRATAMQPMGNYAYAIHFSDGHNTGIYTLEYLRSLGEERGAGDERGSHSG